MYFWQCGQWSYREVTGFIRSECLLGTLCQGWQLLWQSLRDEGCLDEMIDKTVICGAHFSDCHDLSEHGASRRIPQLLSLDRTTTKHFPSHRSKAKPFPHA